MNVNISTKFNIGDIVYVAEYYYDEFIPSNSYTIVGITIDIGKVGIKIIYRIQQDNICKYFDEDCCFDSYEKCTKWCLNHN